MSHDYINYFIDIVRKERPNFHMYYDFDFQLRNFTAYDPKDDDDGSDIQILYSGAAGGNNIGHWKCVQYRARTNKVYVYDSLYGKFLNVEQKRLIFELYLLMEEDTIFVEPKYLQSGPTSCGIHSIFYATTLLLGQDPTQVELKINKVRGDQSLYMRLHVLKMFANRKLALFD